MANESTASTSTSTGSATSSESSTAGVQTQSVTTQADSTQTQSIEQAAQVNNVTTDVAVTKPEPKTEVPANSKLNVNEMIAKQLSGALSDADKAALEKAGLTEEQLGILADSHKQVQLKNNDVLYESVGGKEVYESLKTFALENLSDDEIDVYNEAMRHPNFKIAQLATLGLHAMMQKAKGGSEPQERLSADGSAGASTQGYSDQQELINDMKNWQYGRDRDYTAKVDARRAKSRF